MVVDENNGVSEFEQINPSDDQSSVSMPAQRIPPPAPQDMSLPVPPPAPAAADSGIDSGIDSGSSQDQDENSGLLPSQKSQSIGGVERVGLPPAVPSDAVIISNNNNNINYEMEERKTLDIGNRVSMSMDEVKLNDNIVPMNSGLLCNYTNGSSFIFSYLK